MSGKHYHVLEYLKSAIAQATDNSVMTGTSNVHQLVYPEYRNSLSKTQVFKPILHAFNLL